MMPSETTMRVCPENQCDREAFLAELAAMTAERDRLTAEVERLRQQRDNFDSAVADMVFQFDRITEHFDANGRIIGDGKWRLDEIAAATKHGRELFALAVLEDERITGADVRACPPLGERTVEVLDGEEGT